MFQQIYSWSIYICVSFVLLVKELATAGVLLKSVLKDFTNFTEKQQRWDLFNKVEGWKACNLFEKETPPQLLSCKYREILKNSFLYGIPSVAASENC